MGGMEGLEGVDGMGHIDGVGHMDGMSYIDGMGHKDGHINGIYNINNSFQKYYMIFNDDRILSLSYNLQIKLLYNIIQMDMNRDRILSNIFYNNNNIFNRQIILPLIDNEGYILPFIGRIYIILNIK